MFHGTAHHKHSQITKATGPSWRIRPLDSAAVEASGLNTAPSLRHTWCCVCVNARCIHHLSLRKLFIVVLLESQIVVSWVLPTCRSTITAFHRGITRWSSGTQEVVLDFYRAVTKKKKQITIHPHTWLPPWQQQCEITCLSFFDFFNFIFIFFPEIMLYLPFFLSFKYWKKTNVSLQDLISTNWQKHKAVDYKCNSVSAFHTSTCEDWQTLPKMFYNGQHPQPLESH